MIVLRTILLRSPSPNREATSAPRLYDWHCLASARLQSSASPFRRSSARSVRAIIRSPILQGYLRKRYIPTPAVWKFMLEHYPGRTTMTAFLEEGDEPSSGESKQGEAGRGSLKFPPESLLAIETRRESHVLPPSVSGTEDRPDPHLGGEGSSPLDDDILNAFGMRRMCLGPGAGTGVAWGEGSITGNDALTAEGTKNNPADPEQNGDEARIIIHTPRGSFNSLTTPARPKTGLRRHIRLMLMLHVGERN